MGHGLSKAKITFRGFLKSEDLICIVTASNCLYKELPCIERRKLIGFSTFLDSIVAYSSPVGVKLQKFDFTDRSYDGVFNNQTKTLNDGLGELVDNYFGSHDLQTGWVGFNLSKVAFLFEFTREYSFSAIDIRMRTIAGDESYFERIEVSASSDNRNFAHVRTTRVVKDAEADRLTVGINVYSARYIRCVIATSLKNDLLLISEVSFSKGMLIIFSF